MILNSYGMKPSQLLNFIWPQFRSFNRCLKFNEFTLPSFGKPNSSPYYSSEKTFISTCIQGSRVFGPCFHNSSRSLSYKKYDLSFYRHFCSKDDSNVPRISLDDGSKLLENHPSIIWPSVVQMFRNLFLTFFIVKPYYDNSFKILPFVNTSAKAACNVSELLSTGNFEALSEVMDAKLVRDFKEAYKQLSTKDRLSLLFVPSDIMARALLIIGLIFEEPKDENAKQRVFIELTTVYHVMRGFKTATENASLFSTNTNDLDPSESMIVNFRFLRELTKGVDDQYTITSLNYFKPLKAVKKDS